MIYTLPMNWGRFIMLGFRGVEADWIWKLFREITIRSVECFFFFFQVIIAKSNGWANKISGWAKRDSACLALRNMIKITHNSVCKKINQFFSIIGSNWLEWLNFLRENEASTFKFIQKFLTSNKLKGKVSGTWICLKFLTIFLDFS